MSQETDLAVELVARAAAVRLARLARLVEDRDRLGLVSARTRRALARQGRRAGPPGERREPADRPAAG